MKKKTGIFLIIGIVLALMLTGCGKQSVETETAHTTEEDKLQIGLSFDSFVIERWLRDRDMFVSTAQSLGAVVNVQVAGGEVEEQISQIEYFIQKKMDVIIIIPIDGDALYDVVKEAKSKGICVICYDRIIPNVNADLYITIDNEMVGTLMGEALKKASRMAEISLRFMDHRQIKMLRKLRRDLKMHWWIVSLISFIPVIVITGLQK